MSAIYLKYGTLISPLGVGEKAHFKALVNGLSGVHQFSNSGFNGEDWYLSKINDLQGNRFEHLLNLTCEDLLQRIPSDLFRSRRTLIIVSSTKADLEALNTDTFQSTRTILKAQLGIVNDPIIVSNACISGVLAIQLAADYLKSEKYDDVVVFGIDVLSDFVVFGFQSLFAMSNEPCKPFDAKRSGISLGEASGVVLLSRTNPEDQFSVVLCGGASSNDANHISGPSRTGEGLVRAVSKAFERSGLSKHEVDFISAHGTGTIFNDEMESIAFNRLSMENIPLNSFKGTFGHTLGAAGVIEVITSMLSMEHNVLFKSLGYTEQGTSQPLNVLISNNEKQVDVVLKTASGFGGGNAAILLKKYR